MGEIWAKSPFDTLPQVLLVLKLGVIYSFTLHFLPSFFLPAFFVLINLIL